MELAEDVIIYLEERIPEMAANATSQAFLRTLSEGDAVLIAENGQLLEISPNGTRKVIKKISFSPVVAERKYVIS